MAATLELLAHVHQLCGAFSQAEVDLAQGRPLIEGVVRDNPKVIEYRYIQEEIYTDLGQVLAEQGRTNRARALLQQKIALLRELVRLNPTASEFSMCLVEADFILVGLEREIGHFDLAETACEEALDMMNKALLEPVPNISLHQNQFQTVVESVRLAVRTGKLLSSRAGTLRTLLKEMEEKTPGGALNRADRRLAVQGYLALAEVAASGGSTPEVLEALHHADRTLDVLLRTTPEEPRLRSLKARIEMMRGSALAGAGKVEEAATAADRAVAILEKLAAEDRSYAYDLACALALQARLDPAAPGPPSAAVAALRKAVEAGFDNVYKLNHDEHLEPIRSREDFRRLVHDAEKNAAASADDVDGKDPAVRTLKPFEDGKAAQTTKTSKKPASTKSVAHADLR